MPGIIHKAHLFKKTEFTKHLKIFLDALMKRDYKQHIVRGQDFLSRTTDKSKQIISIFINYNRILQIIRSVVPTGQFGHLLHDI